MMENACDASLADRGTGCSRRCRVTPAIADEDIVLRGMGSFHVGGRIAEVKGKEVRMISASPAAR